MDRLNATEAIAPALSRTRHLLLQPFQVGRSWKLAATSYLSICGSMFVPFPLIFLLIPKQGFAGGRVGSIFWGLSIVFSVVWLAFFWVFARMELVEFDMIVSGTKFIAPLWRRHAGRVWPWVWLKVCIGTLVSVLAAPVVYTHGRHLFDNMPQFVPGQPPAPGVFPAQFHAILTLYALLAVPFLLLKLASTLLGDFVLPFYVLEELPLKAALARGYEVFAEDPLQCVFYLFFKYLLGATGFMMQYVVNLICMIPLYIVVLVIALLGVVVAHVVGPTGKLLLIPCAVVLGITFIGGVFYATIGTFGALMMSLEAYAVYFLGGRYTLLGNLLEPGVARPFTPPPPSAGRDEDDGPPFPMDPVIA